MTVVAILLLVFMTIITIPMTGAKIRYFRYHGSPRFLLTFYVLLLAGSVTELMLFRIQGWPGWWLWVPMIVLLSTMFLVIAYDRRQRGGLQAKPDEHQEAKQKILRQLASRGPLDTSQLCGELLIDEEVVPVILNELLGERRIEIREPSDDPWLIVWGMPTLHFRRRSA